MRHLIAIVSTLGLATACTSDDPPEEPSDWSRLIGRPWSVPENVLDVYKCTRILVEETMYVTGFRSEAPLGSHHAVLTYSVTQDGPMGDYDCDVSTLDFRMLYASGVGTDDLIFPEDVGIEIKAGWYLHLNLHLFNSGDAAISGDSGVAVRALTSPPPKLADMTFAGDMDLAIPPTGAPHVETGGCTLGTDYDVFALWPHQHQFGIHHKFEIVKNGVPNVLIDTPYNFEEQRNWKLDQPLHFTAGDQVNVECTYMNPGPGTIEWGDSSTEEMCFTGMYKYPAGGILFGCVTGLGF
jgi:hypothetical protein